MNKNFFTLLKHLIILAVILLLAAKTPVLADTMTDENNILNLYKSPNFIDQKKDNEKEKVDPRVIVGENFTSTLGLPYVFSVDNFIFSISPMIIDFGIISPTNPIKRIQNISINTGASYLYSITAAEDHELQINSGKTIIIPNTTCDSGVCSPNFGSKWNSTLTFGFGFRCENIFGKGCMDSSDNFRQLATNGTEIPVIMTGVGINSKTQAKITYKLNVSATQPLGLYSNTIYLIAMPGF